MESCVIELLQMNRRLKTERTFNNRHSGRPGKQFDQSDKQTGRKINISAGLVNKTTEMGIPTLMCSEQVGLTSQINKHDEIKILRSAGCHSDDPQNIQSDWLVKLSNQ